MTQNTEQAQPASLNENVGRMRQMFSAFRIQIERYSDSKKLLLISGAKAILHYSTSFLELDMGQEYLIIKGKSMLCRTFVAGNIEVIGIVDDITYARTYVFPEGEAECN